AGARGRSVNPLSACGLRYSHISNGGALPLLQLCWGRWRGAPDGVWPAPPTAVALRERHREPASEHSCFPHPIRPFGPPPRFAEKGRFVDRLQLDDGPLLRGEV